MTPLAAFLAKQIAARPKHRKWIWAEPANVAHLRQSMEDIHCFELTAALPMLADLAAMFKLNGPESSEVLFETYSFLPAPKTWIEWKHGSGNRIAVLFEQRDNSIAVGTFFCEKMAENLGTISTKSGDYYDYGGERHMPTFLTELGGQQTCAAILSAAHSMLLLINSPRIIGRRQHMPNAGLERRLTRSLAGGSFPLHAWTEILLKVSKPPEIDDGEPHEAHLTGRRALHFVRKHIRIRRGQLEYVSAHWRGDPSIGIKQSRYVVTA